MPLPVSFFSLTLADNTLKNNGMPETTTSRVPITTVTAGNFTTVDTAITALVAAIDGITLGVVNRRTTESYTSTATNPAPSSDPLAQRENKYLCRYHDVVNGKRFSVSFGTADLSLHMANSEFLDLTAGPGLALKTAFEAVVVSGDDSAHAVVLDSVQFVGRNS